MKELSAQDDVSGASLWARASELMASHGVERSPLAAKAIWSRELRERSGIDERKSGSGGPMRTSLQKRKYDVVGSERERRGSVDPATSAHPALPTTNDFSKPNLTHPDQTAAFATRPASLSMLSLLHDDGRNRVPLAGSSTDPVWFEGPPPKKVKRVPTSLPLCFQQARDGLLAGLLKRDEGKMKKGKELLESRPEELSVPGGVPSSKMVQIKGGDWQDLGYQPPEGNVFSNGGERGGFDEG
ncbi:MAG: hypothetical protein M1835_004794 [Candelina submexicana]|nr:MAG: hypothetical protein M1835_004794 [Candelina submexicana]